VGSDETRSSIDVSEDDVDGSEDRDGICDEPVFEQPREDLQIHE
jgi:hypothetical protein